MTNARGQCAEIPRTLPGLLAFIIRIITFIPKRRRNTWCLDVGLLLEAL